MDVEAEDREKLTKLVIKSCETTLENITELVRLDWSNLKELSIIQEYDIYALVRCHMTAHEIEELLTNEWPALEKLNLFDNRMRNAGFRFIMETSSLQNLRDLNVGMNQITQFGFDSILETKLTNLTSLNL